MTRGLRNNNPLNIRHSEDKWEGRAMTQTARLLAAMTCVECGIPWKEVDWDAIWQGYDLAYPGRLEAAKAEKAREVWDEYWDWSAMG